MTDWSVFAILGAVEGLTEFIPVSSTGHLILARAFLDLPEMHDLGVDAVLQLAAALAVIIYFWKDILLLLQALLREISGRGPTVERGLLLALFVGTIPAVLLGLLLEQTMATAFRNPVLVAITALLGAGIFVVAEYAFKKIHTNLPLSSVGWEKGLIVGAFQSLALVPGMSRSGMTISGGLFLGLSREAAARFGFLLSVPIILGSGLKKLLELAGDGTLTTIGGPLLLGGAVAFVTGLLAIHGLLLFLRTRSLYAFAVYRVVLATTIFIFLV